MSYGFHLAARIGLGPQQMGTQEGTLSQRGLGLFHGGDLSSYGPPGSQYLRSPSLVNERWPGFPPDPEALRADPLSAVT